MNKQNNISKLFTKKCKGNEIEEDQKNEQNEKNQKNEQNENNMFYPFVFL